MKKIILILLLFLFLMSIIHDLSKPETEIEHHRFYIAEIKITPGDTVLSITEEINSLDNLDINKIIADFEELNPGTDYQVLTPNSFYYFPLYNESN